MFAGYRWGLTAAAAALALAGCPRQVPRDGGAGDGGAPPYDPIAGNAFEGPIAFDDDRVRALDPTALRSGRAPCRSPILGRVYRVTDGDSIRVEGISEVVDLPVRLIGVDTPEIAHDGMPADCFGDQAAAFTRQLQGRLVWLTFDTDCKDDYDRTLAYIHIGAGEGDLWERQLLRRGYGRALIVGDNDAFRAEFEADEAAASRANRGQWGACF